MERKTYVIAVRPGGQPQVTVLGPSGALSAVEPGTSLPHIVQASAAWLSALADKRPLPPGAPPPVVIAPRHQGESFMALVSHGED